MSSLMQTIAHVEAENASPTGLLDAAEEDFNTSFSTQALPLQLAWDSTSLGALKTCPRYYEYSIRLGLVPRSESAHLIFGQEFHAALELYDRMTVSGSDHETALMATVRSVFLRTWRPHIRRPWASDIPEKNRLTLMRAVVWYLEKFRDDPLETYIRADGVPAVELSFRLELEQKSKLTGESFLLCGHLDKVVRFQDHLWIVDRKTTKAVLDEEFFDKYLPDNQMSVYDIAGTIIMPEPIKGLIIDAVQVGVTFARFRRGFVHRTPGLREEWLRDLSYWLSLAEVFAERQHWPQNDKACNMYGGCPYRPLCGTDPNVRPRLESGLYVKRIWDPLKTREI